MSSAFHDPIKLRGLELSNRLFMAPMCQYSAVDGLAGDWHRRHYTERATGGVALVVIEATAVSPEGRISPADLGLWNDAQRDALASVVDAVHRAGTRVAVQLAHAGRKASSRAPWDGKGCVPEGEGGWAVIAPSALAFDGTYAVPRAMDEADIDRVVTSFGEAARRAVEAGIDSVELHAAHGYLIHQFLSPLSNVRTDSYGGDLVGRGRLLGRVVREVRAVIPEGMPLMIRVSATDWVDGGWDVDECARLLVDLEGQGIDFVDVSSGGLDARARMPVGPGYQVALAGRIRNETGLTVGAVGLITTVEQIEQILLNGSADAVSLGRLLLRDPYWPSRNLPATARRIPRQYLRAY